MPNLYTSAALPAGQAGTVVGANLVTQAYDKLVEFALRSVPSFRSVADKKPAQQSHAGSSVLFQLYNDLAVATSPLTETVDPDAVAVPATSTVAVTLNEYGNSIISTRKLDLFSLADVEPALANIVAFNMNDSLDTIVRDVLNGGSQVIRESAGSLSTSVAITTITGTDTIKSRDIRYAVAKLRAANVVPRRGNLFASYIHPEVSHNLRAETGTAGWRQPHEYVDTAGIYAGELGTYEGVAFVESTPTKLTGWFRCWRKPGSCVLNLHHGSTGSCRSSCRRTTHSYWSSYRQVDASPPNRLVRRTWLEPLPFRSSMAHRDSIVCPSDSLVD